MKKLIVMRGLPGCGKSTEANKLRQELKSLDSIICSADDFFVSPADGYYKFDAKQLGRAHETCLNKAAAAMVDSVPVVIVDNTNTKKWEYQKYLDMAEAHGYEVEIKVVGNLVDIDLYAQRNTHEVTKEVISRMAARWEHDGEQNET